VINQPDNGLFCSDLLSLTPELLTAFKTRYLSEKPPGRLTSLCAPVTRSWRLCGKAFCRRCGRIIHCFAAPSGDGPAAGAARGGYAGPLLVERQQDLSAQVRQLVMLSPAQAWSVSRVAKMLFLGESTLRRRLQQESQSFRQIVEEVRMAHALGQLQTTSRPIGEIAQNSGYQSGSRFTARFRQHYGLLPKHVR
jgi:AraC-like DNA-binding protein